MVPWWLGLSTSWRQRLNSVWFRVIIYSGYGVNLAFWCGDYYVRHAQIPVGREYYWEISLPVFRWNVPACLAFLSAFLYLVAGFMGHKHVFSRMLGGPGVERMALVLPGPRPWYEAIAPDAVEGQIRLT